MKKLTLLCLLSLLASGAMAQKKLPKPNMERPGTVMQALQERRSIRQSSDKMLSEQDLSDVLWAAQGANRKDGRMTSPTARNRQEIRLYVLTQKEISLYDPKTHSLSEVRKGDFRAQAIAGQKAFESFPVILLMVADTQKYGQMTPHAQMMVNCDAGIVSQNINIFCACAGLCTTTRGIMDAQALKATLGLDDTFIPILNNPVGYPKN